VSKARALVTTVTPETSGLPRATISTAYFALPGYRALLAPSLLQELLPRELNASVGPSGPHVYNLTFGETRRNEENALKQALLR
jgi:hypothetical protein